MDDDSAALCPKTDGTGSVRKYGEYGYLYVLSPGSQPCLLPVKKVRGRTDQEMDALWRPRVTRWQQQGRGELYRLASAIGVSVAALKELGTGWDGRAWTFPERNGLGVIVGVSRRFEDGSKRCATGSRRGLTYSDGWTELPGPALIVEGASDVAAGDPAYRRYLNAIRTHESVDGTFGKLVGDDGASLGPLHIGKLCWADGCAVLKRGWAWWPFVFSRRHSEQVITAYYAKYAPAALLAGDWATLARLHNGGPSGPTNPVTLAYWKSIEAIMAGDTHGKRSVGIEPAFCLRQFD